MKIFGIIYSNLIKLYKYLIIYGFDKYQTKQDLILLILLADIINSDYYKNLNQSEQDNLISIFKDIIHNNEFLIYTIHNLPNYLFDDGFEFGVIIEALLTEDNEYRIMTEDGYVITYE